MNYEQRLLKASYSTILVSLAVVALLVLPGRAAAEDYNMPVVPLNATTSGVWLGSYAGIVSAGSFVDNFFFTVPDAFTFTLEPPVGVPNGFFNITDLNANLYTNPPGSSLYSAVNLVNPVASGLLPAGMYDLQISGTAGVGGGVYWGAGTLATDNSFLAPVPEPETYAMMLAGLGLMGVVARRRKQSEAA